MKQTFHYKGWFTAGECDALIEYALKKPASPGTTIGSAGQAVTDLRKSEVRFLSRSARELLHLTSKIEHLFIDAQIHAFGLREMYGFNELQFTTYRAENQGHYDFHVDSGVNKLGGDRRLSMIVLLSDPKEFEGGQFEMNPRLDGNCLSEKGDVLFFRSGIRHRVLPVTAGVRHSLVTWFWGRNPE